MLADNQGQPGFRELVIVAHDLDAHCDLRIAERRRRDLFRRPTAAAEPRRAEVIDLSGVGRDFWWMRSSRWRRRSPPIRT